MICYDAMNDREPHSPQMHWSAIDFSLAAKGQDLLHQIARPFGGVEHIVEVTSGRAAMGHFEQCQLSIAQNSD